MLRTVTAPILLTILGAGVQALADPLLAESFEGDVTGWQLVPNRGAEADLSRSEEATLGARSVRIDPRRLAAPDDSELITNVHLRSPMLSLRAGVRYVLSAWMRSDARRLVRLRAADRRGALSGPEFALTDQWQRFEWRFTPEATCPRWCRRSWWATTCARSSLTTWCCPRPVWGRSCPRVVSHAAPCGCGRRL